MKSCMYLDDEEEFNIKTTKCHGNKNLVIFSAYQKFVYN